MLQDIATLTGGTVISEEAPKNEEHAHGGMPGGGGMGGMDM
jgi:hypothetical protein